MKRLGPLTLAALLATVVLQVAPAAAAGTITGITIAPPLAPVLLTGAQIRA